MLTSIWYLGQLLEIECEEEERTSVWRKVTLHYGRLARKVYYIFEPLGVEQIARTRDTTLTKIHKLKQAEYQRLVEQSLAIAGARL
jgi:hypothetical protein